jgi:transcriptional regulator with AAA-type ATPase domain/polyferredoxin
MDTTRVLRTAASKEKAYLSVFSKEVIDYLRIEAREVTFSRDDVIIRRGNPGCAFYIIVSGEIEVRLVGEEEHHLPLARLGPNAGFGEMSLLRDQPASADIVALSPVTLLEYPAPLFRKALAEYEPFRNELMAQMAQSIHDTSAEAWLFHQRAEAFNLLVHKDSPYPEPLISNSLKMQRVEEGLFRLARVPGPILITGEPGTGKLFAAGRIRDLSGSESAPFITVDCSRLGETEAGMLIFGSSQPGTADDRPETFGALHLAHGGILVLRHIDALDHASQKFLSSYLELLDFSGDGIFPFVRVIATANGNLTDLGKDGNITGELFKLLTANKLWMPPLKDRKADILPLVHIFLKHLDPENPKRLSPSAEDALLAMQFRHNNVRELRESVEMAALFCEDGKILSEHIFSGPMDSGIPPEYDLGEVPFIRRIVQGKMGFINFLRGVVLMIFAVIILLCLYAGGSKAGQAANSMIWAVWEPALIFSFLFFGHVWCIICPLSTAALLFQELGTLQRPPPLWIKKFSPWLAVGGFFLIIWTERLFHMTAVPFASGILLLGLITGALVFSVVYQREVWCRFICPLGALASGYSFSSVFHIRARPHICAAHCTTHECYKGTAGIPGCSVLHHPLYMSDAHNCKLCFRCLQLCPHGSVRFYLRPFLQAVWIFGGFAHVIAPFALSVFSLSIVMLVSGETGWLRGPGALTAAALGSIFLGLLLNAVLPRLLLGRNEPDTAVSSRVAAALLVLGWGPLMSYQLSNIPALRTIRFYAVPDSFLGTLFSGFPGGEVTLMRLLQLGVILLAFLLALVAFWRIRVQAGKEETGSSTVGWNILLIFSLLYTAFAVFVTVYPF